MATEKPKTELVNEPSTEIDATLVRQLADILNDTSLTAMKTMNPIQAPRDGVVAEILVGDAQPVEFGEPLVVLAD